MAQQIIPTDLTVQGRLTCTTFYPPANSITAGAIAGSVGAYHGATNFQQQYQKEYAQGSTANAATGRQVLHTVRGLTGLVMDFGVGAVVAGTGTCAVVVDLWKNGASILTATVSLGSGTAAFALLGATLASTAVVAGDVLEVKVVSVNAGSGALPQGLFARLCVREDPN